MDERIGKELTEYALNNHMVTIEGRCHARLTGVIDVESFHEEEAAVLTQAGLVIISGEELRLTRLDPDNGQVVIDGQILSLEYEQQPKAKHGLFARVRT